LISTQVVDLGAVLGARVDNHPASRTGVGDALHFCQPGALDWALDLVVDHVVGAWDAGRAVTNADFANMTAGDRADAALDGGF